MEATFEGGQGLEGAVMPWMDGCMDILYHDLFSVMVY
jgi:hypothetical protein